MDAMDYGPTPMESIPDGHAKEFSIPAPRGLIVARGGEPLAADQVGKRIVLRLRDLSDSPVEALETAEAIVAGFDGEIPLLSLSEEEITQHFTHRPWVPYPVSGVLSSEQVASLESELPAECSLETVYLRSYPEGELMAHIVGYTGEILPDQHGPIGPVEYLWPPTAGRAGLEKTLDETLSGTDGRISRLHSKNGLILNEELARRPKPGETLVLSINLQLQKLAWKQLEASGRPGAFVAVDADTGDILAMVSYPSFDSNLFINGISEVNYRELANREDAPFFDRAVMGTYPPGSTFKPFVALAGMEWGTVDGLETRHPGPPVMDVDGRPFKNWHKRYEGPMDLRYALTRSCNTWFYQAGIDMGAFAIADVSHRFGLGQRPQIPLPVVSPGVIPEPQNYNDPKSLANFSIGQGLVLTSPLQMVMAMAALANGEYVPKPRLIIETQDPLTGARSEAFEPQVANHLHLDPAELEWVREGMWGVVNHGKGTAGRASMSSPVVYGKTGTSEWAEQGEKRSLAWFTGWVDAQEPRIAFAAITQGRRGDVLSGGRSAAPIAAGVLKTAYGDPQTYAVVRPEEPSRRAPQLIAASAYQEQEIIEITPIDRPRNPIGGFFKRIFGRR